MLFVVYNVDKPYSHALRAVTRDEHLAYVAAGGEKVRFAGPLLTPDGEKMAGSLLVLEMESLEEARAWADADPYHKVGLFEVSEVRPWRWTFENGAARQG